MKERLPFWLLLGTLTVSGLGLALARHHTLGIPWHPGQTESVWLVEARIDFIAVGGPITAELRIPDRSPGFQLVNEWTASPGYGFSVRPEAEARIAEWSIREAVGPQRLYYRALVRPDPSGSPAPTPENSGHGYWEPPAATAADNLIHAAHRQSSNPTSFVRHLALSLLPPAAGEDARLLLADQAPVFVLKDLLSRAGISARIAWGLNLAENRRGQSLRPVIEVWLNQQWTIFDPASSFGSPDETFLLWHRGEHAGLDLQGGARSQVNFAMTRQARSAVHLNMAAAKAPMLSFMGLHYLSVEEQAIFQLLLLLPIGALIVVIARIFVGLRTAGTFMPILIAMAFVQADLLAGLLSFLAIVGLGLGLRGYLSKLNLLLVARLASLLVLVVLLITGLSLIGHRMGFQPGLTMTVFPMIIIAWTIERMSIVWEEQGALEVLVQGLGSLLVAIPAWFAMSAPLVRHLSFSFPELNLVLLAGILLAGRYTGYRLLELLRFRDFIPNRHPP